MSFQDRIKKSTLLLYPLNLLFTLADVQLTLMSVDALDVVFCLGAALEAAQAALRHLTPKLSSVDTAKGAKAKLRCNS